MPIRYDGTLLLHHEVYKEAVEALKRGWTDDVELYAVLCAQGVNYPEERVVLRKKEK